VDAPERALLAERVAAVERHLARVAEQLPDRPEDLGPSTAQSDSVVLHLWQAVQLTIDLAVSWCVRSGLGAPPTYGDAFRRLAGDGRLDEALAERMVRAVGLRDVVVHAYADLDLAVVHAAALSGPADLRAFAAALLADR
jgi:uncharacterized protein YutE (UPF0331/DUF86 family)